MFFRALHASFVQETKRYIILAMLTESPRQKTQDYAGSDVFLEMILFSFFCFVFLLFYNYELRALAKRHKAILSEI